MSNTTSTAALAYFRHGLLTVQRRAPRHPWFRTQNPMSAINQQTPSKSFAAVIARVTLSLLLWTFGASAMDLRLAQLPPKVHRVVINFPINRAHAEELQRWVNAGHDPWCLDPQLVAASALRRISPELADYESTSISLELARTNTTESVYTFHSLDGHTTYRITLKRHLYLLPSAGSLHRIVWIPEAAEIITRDTVN